VADYCPDWWPATTRLLIRRVRLDPTTQLGTDSRARRRRTVPPSSGHCTPTGDGRLTGHGPRGGQAMIATLRHRLICVPARLVHHAGALTLRLPPGHHLLAEVLARLRALPTPP
jgi:hypothetical protein